MPSMAGAFTVVGIMAGTQLILQPQVCREVSGAVSKVMDPH